MKLFFPIICIIVSFKTATTQVFPSNYDTLHSIQVIFQVNEHQKCTKYRILIYDKNNTLIHEKSISSLAYLSTDLLEFDKGYYWTYEGFYNNKKIYSSPNFQFFINGYTKNDTSLYRYKVTKQDNFNNNLGIVFLDGNGTAINKFGKVIWQHKSFIKNEDRHIAFRNINLTPQGEVVYLEQNNFECETIHGKKIFSANKKSVFSNDINEHYHHDGIKLKNGNYLISSYRFESSSNLRSANDNGKLQYGTILELSKDNKLLWSWNEKDYTSNKEYLKLKSEGETTFPGNHLNGFDYDSNTGDLIVSFRDNNRLVKTNKKTNRLLYNIYPTQSNDLYFTGQHSPMFSLKNSNSFYFYNNNLNRTKKKEQDREEQVQNATIIEMKEMLKDSIPVKVWEYEIACDSFPNGTTGKEGFVQPLQNGNLIVCQGGGNRIFELTKSKEIIWECFTYNFSKNSNKWEPFTNYRCRYYSSLYPRYFTVQHKLPNFKNQIKINNDGTDDDEYEVILVGNPNKILKTIKIVAGKSAVIQLKPNEKSLLIKPKGIEGLDKEINL